MLLPNLNFGALNLFHLALMALIIGLFFNKKQKTESIKGLDRIFKIYAISIMILSLVSVLMGQYLSMTNYLTSMISLLLDYILIGVLFNHIFFQNIDIKIFDYTLYYTTTIVVLYAFLNYYLKSNPYQAYIVMYENMEVDMSNSFLNEERGVLRSRVSSTFAHPLMLGQVLLLATSYIQYKIQTKIYRWLAISALLLTTFMTGCRSSIVPIIVSVLLCTFCHKSIELKKNVLLTLVFIIVTYVMIPKSYQDTILDMINVWNQSESKIEIQGSSTELRQNQLQSTVNILDSDIIIGRGKGYVNYYGKKHKQMFGYESIIFTELFDNGIIGLLLFFIFYITLYIKLLKFAKTKRNKYRVHSLCLPFLLSGIMTGNQYGIFTIYIILYIMTLHSIRNEENVVSKIINYDTKNNTLLLAQR